MKIALPEELQLSVDFLREQKACATLDENTLTAMAQRAIAIGAQYSPEYAGKDAVSQVLTCGAKVEMHKGGVIGNRLIRAQYDHSIKTVVVYEDGITLVMKTPAAEILGIPNTVAEIRELLVWHEFFHVLEFTSIGLVGKRFPIPGKILWLTRNKPFYPISEICANAFTMRVMDLPYSPFIIDYLANQAAVPAATKEGIQ